MPYALPLVPSLEIGRSTDPDNPLDSGVRTLDRTDVSAGDHTETALHVPQSGADADARGRGNGAAATTDEREPPRSGRGSIRSLTEELEAAEQELTLDRAASDLAEQREAPPRGAGTPRGGAQLPSAAQSEARVPLSTAPASLPPPRGTELGGGPEPACPQCEAPMTWVDEHLRFYCKQCRMYF